MLKKDKKMSWGWTIVLIAIGLVCIYPFLFMVSSSFKISGDVLTKPLQLIPDQIIFSNYSDLFGDPYYDFGQWYINTIVMTVTTIVIKVFVVSITAYAFSKINFKGRDGIFLVLLTSLMIPSDIMLIPRYVIFKQIHILDTMWSLVLPATFDIYFVFMMRQAFIGIREEISEAARIDGCSHFQIYSRIILPLAKPVIATISLFISLNYWNDWWLGIMLIDNTDLQPLQLLLRTITSNIQFLSSSSNVNAITQAAGSIPSEGIKMATCIATIGPIILVYPFVQKYFVKGIMVGAVKG